MKLLEFNSNACKTNGIFESIALRIGVLFAQQAIAAGNGISWIDPETSFKTNNYQQKIFLTTIINTTAPEFENDEPQRVYNQMLKYWKTLKSIKHPTPFQINERKKYEHILDKAYQETITFLVEKAKEMGLYQLKDLITYESDDTVIDFYATNMFDETAESIEGNVHKMVNLLQFKVDLGEDTINKANHHYWLGIDAFVIEPDMTEVVKKVYTLSDAEAADMANLYAEPFITLPNINKLLKEELLTLRNNLLPVTQPFQAAVNEWIKLAATDAAQSVGYFKSHIQPQFAALQQAIDNDEVLQSVAKIVPDENMELMLGEIALPMLWDFYFEHKLFNDEIYAELQAAKQTGNWNYRMPFVTIKLKSDFVSNVTAKKEEDIIKPSKKSLDID